MESVNGREGSCVLPFSTGMHLPDSILLLHRAVLVGFVAIEFLIVAGAIASAAAITKSRATAERILARRLVAVLQRLGPTFIKLGQILSTRRDVLSPILCDELALLHDSVKPLAPDQARTALTSAYGPYFSEVFTEIDCCPVASGSVACVYRARLRDGSDVAIKMQRPGIRRVIAADLNLISLMAAGFKRVRLLSDFPVQAVLQGVCNAVYEQLDFAREMRYLQQLHDNLASTPGVWVPRPVPTASRDTAIVMEFIPGLDVQCTNEYSAAGRRKCAANLLRAVYQLIFVDGFVHCDLHPGNLYFTRSGQVVILDAGFSIQMPDRIRRLFGEFFLNMSLGRGRRCAEIVIESSVKISPKADLAAFTVDLDNLVRRSSGRRARAFSLLWFAAELFDLQRKFGLQAAPDLVFPLLCLLVIEGTIRDLDPEMDFQKVAEPVLTRGLFGQPSNQVTVAAQP